MNLLDFRNRIISSDPNKIETDSFFSEEITIFNILNGFFKDENILSINIDTDKKNVSVEVFSEELAKYAENSLNNQIAMDNSIRDCILVFWEKETILSQVPSLITYGKALVVVRVKLMILNNIEILMFVMCLSE